MTAFLRRLAAFLALALAASLPARATTYSIDFTDIWWNANESGWGLNIVQRSNIIFATMFHYGSDNSDRWFSATLLPAASQPSGLTVFTGQLVRTRGPWFGAPAFNASTVTAAVVGTMTVSFNSPTTATLTYTADGVTVTKDIARQPFGAENLTGQYQGGMIAIASNCTNSSNNGLAEIPGTVNVSHTGTPGAADYRIRAQVTIDSSTACVFEGPYQQVGRLATVSNGTFSCVISGQTVNSGTFSLSALDAQVNGFHSVFVGRDQFCNYNGRFGATRDAIGN